MTEETVAKKCKKRVRISESPPRIFILPPIPDAQAQQSGLWYSSGEINEFKANARRQARLMVLSMIRSKNYPSGVGCVQENSDAILRAYKQKFIEQHIKDEHISGEDRSDEAVNGFGMRDINFFRGLEYRASFERQHARHLAIRAVLITHRRLKDISSSVSAENAVPCLASISQKYTRQAREEAHVTGRLDLQDSHNICNSTFHVIPPVAACCRLDQAKRKFSNIGHTCHDERKKRFKI
uniref:Uncharacterized protein n=1 Tax=Odontella aurita TaxID=265563 RepID=A0A7S4JL73_9STRA|mmetsp:Transcript_48670/g.146711  ORF Transcript_48670/g.146711 Transcript_48670/m.146711 type:complete len:239 (+) Transcript_48670:122-838(+)